ncbi:uncharacterized protein [Parasteatoda tepidariorum]|uniref:uncharacterized protein isoform X2 n=1 Tax=Parasteatoda tepidariorum TaxID=114398 RepID=UPI00077FA8C2|nr:uncharacterized protein LOC107443067 isoform X2 [Parasteatoda tepidariorum]
MDNWDFDCPQFVDFAAALNSPSDEIFHDVASDVQEAANFESNNLGPKVATPKIKPNDPLKNFPFINFSTDDEKLATLSKLPARLSKSDGHLNQIKESIKSPDDKENPRTDKNKRRTSFPMNYIRKRRVCPKTPNCLKRTLNTKSKGAKTSEELELQKIAELQNMLHKHLRLNKINLKRLKNNKAPFTMDKLPKKDESKVPSKKNNLFAAPKPAPKSDRNFIRENNFACRSAVFSQGVKENLKVLQCEEKLNAVAKKKAPSNVLRDRNVLKEDSGNALKKQMQKSLSVSRNTPCLLNNKENLVK